MLEVTEMEAEIAPPFKTTRLLFTIIEVDGVDTICLFDSASSISLINAKLAKECVNSPIALRSLARKSELALKTSLTIKIGERWLFTHSAYVSTELKRPILLGSDFFAGTTPVLDYKKMQITYPDMESSSHLYALFWNEEDAYVELSKRWKRATEAEVNHMVVE